MAWPPSAFPVDGVGTHGDLRDWATDVETELGVARRFVGARAYQSSALTIPHNTATVITLDSEDFDSDGFHSTASNTSRMTIPTGLGGKYLLAGTIGYAANATGGRQIRFYKNGVFKTIVKVLPLSGEGVYVQGVDVIDLAAGDYVEMYGLQFSGSSLGTDAGTEVLWFSVVRLGE